MKLLSLISASAALNYLVLHNGGWLAVVWLATSFSWLVLACWLPDLDEEEDSDDGE